VWIYKNDYFCTANKSIKINPMTSCINFMDFHFIYTRPATLLFAAGRAAAACLWLLLPAFTSMADNATVKGGYTVTHYDEYDGLSQRYITSIVQGDDGYIWIGTWNGIDRFDGYEFVNFKPRLDDGCQLPSDRIVSMIKGNNGNLYCLIEKRIFVFNTYTKRYSEMLEEGNLRKQVRKRFDKILRTQDNNPWLSIGTGVFYQTKDDSGCVWLRSNFGMYKLTPTFKQYTVLPQEKAAQIRCFFRDREGQLWVTSKDDMTVRVYDRADRLLGYLHSDGSIGKRYAKFGAAVYCIFQDKRGRLLLGSKPKGLFMLTPIQGRMGFNIKHYMANKADKYSLSDNEIYDIKEDSRGRLWIATFQQGLNCMYEENGRLYFANHNNILRSPKEHGCKVRHILITQKGALVASTTEGLLVADVSKGRLNEISFRLHEKEIGRASSLSNNATMYTIAAADGNLYVLTESGGLNITPLKSLLDERLSFTHQNTHTGFPTDITLSAIEYGGSLWVVSNSSIIKYNPVDGKSVSFNAKFFRGNFRFSDAVPVRLTSGRWLFGLQDGAITLSLDSLSKSKYKPRITITGMSVQNKIVDYASANSDTITLAPGERNLTVHFSATDYREPESIEYAFRIDNGSWNHIGHNRSATLWSLSPGLYKLSIKSTNSDGVWADNTKQLAIIVLPNWYETVFAKIIYIMLIIAAVLLAIYIIMYIRRIKHQKEKLETYLNLATLSIGRQQAESNQPAVDELLAKAQVMAADDIFMKKILAYVEAHIVDTDINIQSMAEAAATSRAGLNRKMKSLLGVTPIAFVSEVRIQKACKLLRESTDSISDVALACGFSDQRYFSKCFKKKYGKTPSEYRNACR